MPADTGQNTVATAEAKAAGHEDQVIRALVPDAVHSVAHQNRWRVTHPKFPGAKLRFDTETLTWEITAKDPAALEGLKHPDGEGLVGFIRRATGQSTEDAATAIVALCRKQGWTKAAAKRSGPDPKLYGILPARWLALTLNEGRNAGRAATCLLIQACLQGYKLRKWRTDPPAQITHREFAAWGLNPASTSRAIRALVAAKLIQHQRGKGREQSTYILRIARHFAPKLDQDGHADRD